MKGQFQFDLETIFPRMKEAVGKAFSILGRLWAWVHGVKLDLFLFHYAEKYYMLICCAMKLLLAQVYESPLHCSNNVTNKLYGSSETTALSRILCLLHTVEEECYWSFTTFKTFTETFSSDFSDRADLWNQLCSLKEAQKISKN